MADLASNEQLNSLNLLKTFPHPLIPDLRLIDLPVSQNKERAAINYSPPLLGEQSDNILYELGYTDDEIRDFRKKSVID